METLSSAAINANIAIGTYSKIDIEVTHGPALQQHPIRHMVAGGEGQGRTHKAPGRQRAGTNTQ